MVGEFADLQGLMGYYYALKDGEDKEVASAIVQQYLPRYAGDALPDTLTGNILSLAEKIDTIAGLFAIKQPPTGSKDPFAIRRAALGVLRILVENQFELNILETLSFALKGFDKLDIESGTDQVIFEFMLERFRAWYQDKGIPIEVFQSVRALEPRSPLDFDKRISAVHHFSNLEQAAALASANKRVSNLVTKSGLENTNNKVDPGLFESDAERALFDLILEKELDLAPLIQNHDYSNCLVALSTLRDPVDVFFADVMVMSDVEAIKVNRIMLLKRLRELFLQVADVSLLHSS
jgi:glycyl-tRNA synthetase beta chain